MTLCFVLVGSQIKRFRTVLRALAAIGSELLVEGVPERLVLRAINSARSAFLAVSLSAAFFESYNVFAQSGLVQAGVLIKHVLATFRSPRVSSMSCELNPEECVLKVNLKCDNGLLKRYGLDVNASDILQANLDGQDLPVTVVAQSAELNKLLNTFQSSLDEVTIIALPEQQAGGSNGPAAAAVQRCVKIQSFYDPCKGASGRSLHTALSLDSHSSSVFKAYAHSGSGPCDVTINLKDFKALVGLCVELGADVQLKFGDAGMPLLAVPHVPGVQEMDYTAELILATLQESQVPPDDAAWNPQAAGGAAAAAANAQAAAGAARAAADGAETIAAATTTAAAAGGPGLTTAAGGAAAGGGGDVTPQGGMHSSNNQFIRFNNAPAGGGTAQQQQRRHSTAAAGAGMAAGSGGGGASGSSRRSGLNRLQRLEQQLEEAEADRAAAVAPYSRLASSFAQQASGAAATSGGAAAGEQAAVSSRGGAGGSPAAAGWQQRQQHTQPAAPQFAAAGGRGGDSQAGDPEELPGGGIYSRQQQLDQQQPDPAQQQWLPGGNVGQQQQQQFVDMQVGDECDDEFPLTPEHEMQDDDWQQ